MGNINPDDVEAMFKTNVLGLVAMTQLLVRRKTVSYIEGSYLDA